MGWLHVDISKSRIWMWLFQPRPGLSHCRSSGGRCNSKERNHLVVLKKTNVWLDHRKIDVHRPQMMITHQIQKTLDEVLVGRSHSLQRIWVCGTVKQKLHVLLYSQITYVNRWDMKKKKKCPRMTAHLFLWTQHPSLSLLEGGRPFRSLISSQTRKGALRGRR